MRVAIVVENTGGAEGFDLNVVDQLLPEYAAPTGGFNLQVHRGDGSALAFTGDLFTTGIDITDPSATEGAINSQSNGVSDGSNLVIITYDVQLQDSVEIDQLYTSTANGNGLWLGGWRGQPCDRNSCQRPFG